MKTRPRTNVGDMTIRTTEIARVRFDQRQSDLLAPDAATDLQEIATLRDMDYHLAPPLCYQVKRQRRDSWHVPRVKLGALRTKILISERQTAHFPPSLPYRSSRPLLLERGSMCLETTITGHELPRLPHRGKQALNFCACHATQFSAFARSIEDAGASFLESDRDLAKVSAINK